MSTIRWKTKILGDYAYATATDETGLVRYAYARVDAYPFEMQALEAAVEDVQRQIRGG